MKKRLFVVIAVALCVTASLFAQHRPGPDKPGFTGPGSGRDGHVDTVAEALNMRDDQHVTLRGHIVQQVGGDMYLFSDGHDKIRAEIDHDVWRNAGVKVNDKTLLEISGEIEKKAARRTVDVYHLREIPPDGRK
jgi:uncharacterized protein (TIGR00156 family)